MTMGGGDVPREGPLAGGGVSPLPEIGPINVVTAYAAPERAADPRHAVAAPPDGVRAAARTGSVAVEAALGSTADHAVPSASTAVERYSSSSTGTEDVSVLPPAQPDAEGAQTPPAEYTAGQVVVYTARTNELLAVATPSDTGDTGEAETEVAGDAPRALPPVTWPLIRSDPGVERSYDHTPEPDPAIGHVDDPGSEEVVVSGYEDHETRASEQISESVDEEPDHRVESADPPPEQGEVLEVVASATEPHSEDGVEQPDLPQAPDSPEEDGENLERSTEPRAVADTPEGDEIEAAAGDQDDEGADEVDTRPDEDREVHAGPVFRRAPDGGWADVSAEQGPPNRHAEFLDDAGIDDEPEYLPPQPAPEASPQSEPASPLVAPPADEYPNAKLHSTVPPRPSLAPMPTGSGLGRPLPYEGSPARHAAVVAAQVVAVAVRILTRPLAIVTTRILTVTEGKAKDTWDITYRRWGWGRLRRTNIPKGHNVLGSRWHARIRGSGPTTD